MTVLIISTFGATKNYPDQEMMKKTFGAFLNSLARQTDKDFKLFLSCHDKPDMKGIDHDWIEWRQISGDKDNDMTLAPSRPPNTAIDAIGHVKMPYGSKLIDMGRKTLNSAIEAGMWAFNHGLPEFWMLRMDSDDLLAKDFIETIHSEDKNGLGAVFNNRCHIYDPKLKEIGIYDYPYSTTCNAIKIRIKGNEIINWYYLCTDHTLFGAHLRRDRIPYKNIDWTLCITSNTGNTISGRGRIEENREAKIMKIDLTEDLINRYGLDAF